MIDKNLEFTKTINNNAQTGMSLKDQQRVDYNQTQEAGPTQIQGGRQEASEGNFSQGGLPARGQVSQSMEAGMGRRQPRNDYEYIKLKNSAWGNKFDIISNKIKDFAKQ